jgi:hypothetical protein
MAELLAQVELVGVEMEKPLVRLLEIMARQIPVAAVVAVVRVPAVQILLLTAAQAALALSSSAT